MTIELREASFQDVELLLGFMAEFNREESIDFDPEIYRARLNVAFQFSQLVKIWLLVASSEPIGYAVLTFTFSFEFGGVQAAIDEIYLCPKERRKGLGTLVLECLEHEAINSGAKTLWGDISDEKPWLSSFYERAGFTCYPYRPYRKQL
jgi:GNAT superfamily N-acetyltransferase